MKKLFSLALVLILTMALAVPASAANASGAIEVKNPTFGKEYAGYKLLDMTYDTVTTTVGGQETTKTIYAYTIEGVDKNGDACADTSQFFDLVSGKVKLKYSNPAQAIPKFQDSPFTVTLATGTENTYVVEQKAGVKDSDVLRWMHALTEMVSNKLNAKRFAKDLAAITPDEDHPEVKWEQVPVGYYLVTSGLGTLVSMDFNNSGTITIIDKNQAPGKLTKSANDGYDTEIDVDSIVDADSVAYGQEVTYTLTFNATNYDAKKQISKYTIHDELSAGLTLDQDEITGQVGSKALTKDTDYTVSVSGTKMEIAIDWVDDANVSLYPANAVVTVTYKATVADGAAVDTALTNTAWYTWNEVGGDPTNPDGTSTTDSWEVKTYALAINKVDPNGRPLDGAKFELTDKATGAAIKVADKGNGVYHYDPAGAGNELVSPDSGVIVVKSLENGTYTVTETEAPNGYNLLTSSVDIVATLEKSTANKITMYLDENGEVVDTVTSEIVEVALPVAAYAVTIINSPGSSLPTTGGTGTSSFYAIGGVLMAGAVVLLLATKKKEQ